MRGSLMGYHWFVSQKCGWNQLYLSATAPWMVSEAYLHIVWGVESSVALGSWVWHSQYAPARLHHLVHLDLNIDIEFNIVKLKFNIDI